MIMDDPGPATFEVDPADDWKLSFTVADAEEPGGRRLLMWFRCFEEEKLRGVTAWLGERQHLWAEWQAIADLEGGAALSRLLSHLAEEGAFEVDGMKYLFEVFEGASIVCGQEGTDIELSVRLATRTLPIITHAFSWVGARDAFMEQLARDPAAGGCVALAELALLKGRGALAARLDEIAVRLLPVSGRIPQ